MKFIYLNHSFHTCKGTDYLQQCQPEAFLTLDSTFISKPRTKNVLAPNSMKITVFY